MSRPADESLKRYQALLSTTSRLSPADGSESIAGTPDASPRSGAQPHPDDVIAEAHRLAGLGVAADARLLRVQVAGIQVVLRDLLALYESERTARQALVEVLKMFVDGLDKADKLLGFNFSGTVEMQAARAALLKESSRPVPKEQE